MDPKKFVLLATTLGIITTGAILPAEEDQLIRAAKQGADAQTKLAALLKALGVEDSDGAIGKVTSMLKQASELEAAMPELKSLREDKAKKDAADEEDDVNDAIAAHRLPEQVRDALILLRRSDKKKFAEQYPLPKASERHLSTSVFANSKDGQLGSVESGARRTQLTALNGGAGGRVGADPTEEELAIVPGPNVHAKAMNFVKANVPGGDKLSFDELHQEGSRLLARVRANKQAGARR